MNIRNRQLVLLYEHNGGTIGIPFLQSDVIQVDWGDGTINSDPTHYYSNTGNTYTQRIVTITTVANPTQLSFSTGYGSTGKDYLVGILASTVNLSSLTTLSACFQGCYDLKFFPDDIFHNIPNVTSVNSMFRNCSSLENIPGNLFNGASNIETCDSCFAECENLRIPNNLFANLSNATSFDRCFQNTNIKSVPSNTFSGCANANSFLWCFANCSSITAIPSGLFSSCIKATSFNYCFHTCVGLTAIPSSLFASQRGVAYGFVSVFNGCENVTSSVPALWEYPRTPIGTGCFSGCTKAANYNSIPSDWK